MSKRRRRYIQNLQQAQYPKEFRIPAPPMQAQLKALTETIMQSVQSATVPTPAVAEPEWDAMKDLAHFLADAGTGLWRLRQKMLEPGTDKPLEEMCRAYRHFESVWDAFTQAGIKICDHTNNPFDAGLSLKVIAYEPTPGIRREKVIETIKPSIFYKQRPIQLGEVIVGTPEGAGPTPSTAAAVKH